MEEDVVLKYKQALKVLHTLQYDMDLVEKENDTSVLRQSKISSNINAFIRLSEELNLAQRNLPPKIKELWQLKIKKLLDDGRVIRNSIERFLLLAQAQRREDEENQKQHYKKNQRLYDSEDRIQKLLYDDGESIYRSHRNVHAINQMGLELLELFRNQNYTLENAKRTLIEAANTMGITHTLMKYIKRRHLVDSIIVYSGIIFTIVFIVFLVYMFRW